MEKMQEEKNYKMFNVYFKGVVIFLCISLILILILSLLLTFTRVKENIITPGIIFISMISILIPSFLLTKKIKKKGILNGSIFGIICMLLLYIVSSFINMQFEFNVNLIIMVFFGILGGSIGGIIGVNIK